MSVKETLKNKNWLVAGGALIAIAIATYVIVVQANTDKLVTEYYRYYTDDDGKSFFADSVEKIAPFQKGGKEVVRAHVFDVNGKPTVMYMSKLSDEAKAAIAKYDADVALKPKNRPASAGPAQAALNNGWIYKKPGDTQWSKKHSDLQLNLKEAKGTPLAEIEYQH